MMTLGITLLTFIIGYFIFQRILVEKNDLTQIIQKQELVESAKAILQTKNDAYGKMVFDYSVFSWMVDFIRHPSKNAGEQTISHPLNLGINIIQIYDLSKKLIYSDLSPDIKDTVGLNGVFDLLYQSRTTNFFLKTKYGLVQFFGSTVHPSKDVDRSSKPQGYFFFGKCWDTKYIRTLEEITNSHVVLSLDNNSSGDRSDGAGKISLNDYNSREIAHISVSKTNPYLENIKQLNTWFDIFFITFCLLSFVIIFQTFKVFVLLPLGKIEMALNTEKVESIERLGQKPDEFGKIAKLIESFFVQRDELKNKVSELSMAQKSMNELNVRLSSQHGEIEEQYLKLHYMNDEMRSQNEEIIAIAEGLQAANKEITDSINYASMIQQAVLAPSYELSQTFPEHFIINKPRNIVSGDFYWFKEMKNGDSILAVADCTGHGLSGSLLSMLGVSFLNQIMMQLEDKGYTAASILDNLKQFFIQALHQTGGDTEYVQDGMHIALCIFSKSFKTMQYATAFHTICLARRNSETGHPEIIEYKGNRIPVGIYYTNDPFTNFTIELQQNDVVYMFSDGMTDQFGGPENKKFMHGRLRKLLETVSQEPLTEQKDKVLLAFDRWKGNLEQTDDMILLGIKIP
jgi:serine phosphatase RsbU (regulator of sigma subunit)